MTKHTRINNFSQLMELNVDRGLPYVNDRGYLHWTREHRHCLTRGEHHHGVVAGWRTAKLQQGDSINVIFS